MVIIVGDNGKNRNSMWEQEKEQGMDRNLYSNPETFSIVLIPREIPGSVTAYIYIYIL